MAKIIRSYRISPELDTLLKAEAERLSNDQGKKVSEADVIEIAVVAWLSGGERNTPAPEGNTPDKHTVAMSALREAESKYHDPLSNAVPVPRRAESVAQRKEREAKEHAAKLAEADITARMVGRGDIEYDLENVPHRSVLHVTNEKVLQKARAHYEVQPREAKPLTRPHGSTEAKRRREQT